MSPVIDIASSSITSEFRKVPGVLYLYRNTETAKYYAEKKVSGKRREKSLGTSNRKIAERRLKESVESLEN